jgi:hypothetical protein
MDLYPTEKNYSLNKNTYREKGVAVSLRLSTDAIVIDP